MLAITTQHFLEDFGKTSKIQQPFVYTGSGVTDICSRSIPYWCVVCLSVFPGTLKGPIPVSAEWGLDKGATMILGNAYDGSLPFERFNGHLYVASVLSRQRFPPRLVVPITCSLRYLICIVPTYCNNQ